MVNIWGWQFWLLLLVLIIFVIWLMWGGKKHQFVGLAPLDPNYPLDQKTISNISSLSNISRRPVYHQDDNDDDYDKEDDDDDYDKEDLNRVTISQHRSKVEASEEMMKRLNPVINSTPEIPEEVVQKAQTLKYRPIYPQHLKRKKHRSKVEAYCCEIMEEIYGVPFNMTNPEFLRNPETGRKLEIDCYNEDLKIGLEYNGPTHYLWPNYTTQTKEEFIKQIRRDQYKVDACDANGVYLITVPYNVPNEMLRSFIEYYLPENVNQRLYGDRPMAETATCQI